MLLLHIFGNQHDCLSNVVLPADSDTDESEPRLTSDPGLYVQQSLHWIVVTACSFLSTLLLGIILTSHGP